jgi:hypothetical protein
MRAAVAVLLVCLTLGGCGSGGGESDEDSFASNQDRRQAAAGGDPDVHTVAEGLASARGTCRELESAGTVDDLDDIARRMENSLSGRYFVDAAVRWVCPDQEGRVDELIESGVVDYRALCDEDEGDIGCAGGIDPLDFDPHNV